MARRASLRRSFALPLRLRTDQPDCASPIRGPRYGQRFPEFLQRCRKVCCTHEAARGAGGFFSSEFLRRQAGDHPIPGSLNTRDCEPGASASDSGTDGRHFWHDADVRNAGRQDATKFPRSQHGTRSLGDSGSIRTAVRTFWRVADEPCCGTSACKGRRTHGRMMAQRASPRRSLALPFRLRPSQSDRPMPIHRRD